MKRIIGQSVCLLSTFLFINAAVTADNGEVSPPGRIRMMPIVLVAADQKAPTQQHIAAWMKNLTWTQRYFAERLNGDSFELATDKPEVIRLRRPLTYYRSLRKGEAAFHWTAELLDHFQVNRFNCPYTFCCLVMNSQGRWPIGGGRSINGGVNRGGGLLVISSFAIERMRNFQSTLRHEIAHTVGLPHVDVYGYDMQTTRSIMAYNTMHQTNGFQESKTPARLIPEDLRVLALADSVFPKTRFDIQTDIPTNYHLFPRVITLPAMKIPGQPEYGPQFSTPSGEDSGSKVSNLNQTFIPRSIGPGVTFDSGNMWASKKQTDGQIILNIRFPVPVTLTRILIHSEHSGQYNPARNCRVDTVESSIGTTIADTSLDSADASIQFAETTAASWQLTLRSGKSGKVCLRGLQFFCQDEPVFPPPVPYDWEAAAAR